MKSKKIKDYFLEFAMIFLAVTLGFFAESYRENLSDNNHERQLIASFIEDLKSDTTNLRISLNFRHKKLKMIDSLMFLLENKQIKGHEGELYYYGRRLVRSTGFQSNDRTISQVNNSGTGGLIRNEKAMNGIISYRKLVEVIVRNHDDEHTERQNAFPVLSQMFNPFVFEKMLTANGVIRPEGNPPLRSYDPDIQLDLAFWAHQMKGSEYILENRLTLLQRKAVDLMKLLEKEYELK